VNVLVARVVVGQDQGLVGGEAHLAQHTVHRGGPLLAGEVFALGQAQAEVIDGLFDAGAQLLDVRAHDLRGVARVADAVEVAVVGPRHAVQVGSISGASLKIGGEARKAGAQARAVAGPREAAALEDGHRPGSSASPRRAARNASRRAPISARTADTSRSRSGASWRRTLAVAWMAALAASGGLVIPFIVAGLSARTVPQVLGAGQLEWSWAVLAAVCGPGRRPPQVVAHRTLGHAISQ
jgi:hypothetical protein